MAQTFDILFARTGGNSFGWKGRGQLSIDAGGVNVALRRGLASLLARPRIRRIPAETIQEVYREGDALRVEFSTSENPRATLPFRVRDADTAARLVQLLPTTRTVEMERGPDPRPRSAPRHAPVKWAAALMVVAAGAALFMRNRRHEPTVETSAKIAAPALDGGSAVAAATPTRTVETAAATGSAALPPGRASEPIRYTTPEEARKLALLAEDPVDWTTPPPTSTQATTEAAARTARMNRVAFETEPEADAFVPMEIPELRIADAVVPIRQTSLAYATARALLGDFEAAANDLDERYRDQRARFEDGSLDARTFANRLDALEIRWRGLGDGLLSDRKYADPALTGLRATLVSVVIQQRNFLAGYGAGLRDGNQDAIDRAFRELARAVEAMARARAYVS